MKNLWEILVPTQMGDTAKPIRLRHHKEWDKYVRSISGGLTILQPVKGQWVSCTICVEERVIPVRVCCTDRQLKQIVKFTLNHYRQKVVMAYKLSNEVLIYGQGNT